MIKQLFFLLCCFTLQNYFIQADQIKFNIAGESAILMNAETGDILFEKDAYAPYYPASTTKVAVALYALKIKKPDLNQMIVAQQESLGSISPEAKRRANYNHPPYWLETDGTHIGIKKGEELSMKDLLAGMLICSGNDAANVIADTLGPTIPAFMEQLNVYLKSIGCKNTCFCNPHGLHDPKHISTAYDLAIMTKEALKEPVFCDLVKATKFLRPKTNKQAAATMIQTNRLLKPGKYYYPKAIGVKTGYHSHSKKNFVGAAQFEGRTLIVVLLGYPQPNEIFLDATKLFDAAFNQPKIKQTFLPKGPQKFTRDFEDADSSLVTYLETPLELEFYPAEDPQVKCLLYWKVESVPIKKNQIVAELHLVSKSGRVLTKGTLYAMDDVKLKWPYSWFFSLQQFFLFHPILAWMELSVLVIGVIVSTWFCFKAKSS